MLSCCLSLSLSRVFTAVQKKKKLSTFRHPNFRWGSETDPVVSLFSFISQQQQHHLKKKKKDRFDLYYKDSWAFRLGSPLSFYFLIFQSLSERWRLHTQTWIAPISNRHRHALWMMKILSMMNNGIIVVVVVGFIKILGRRHRVFCFYMSNLKRRSILFAFNVSCVFEKRWGWRRAKPHTRHNNVTLL